MKTEDFTLNLGTDQVPWRIFIPEQSSKEYCVLWIQGWSSSMDSHRKGVERMSKTTGMTFATLDPAGHGLHKLQLDESTRKMQFDEVVAVFDELKKLGYDKIIVVGGSFGGYLAALLIGQRPAHAAVMRVPANYPDDEFELKSKETMRSEDRTLWTSTKDSNDTLVNSMATDGVKNYDGFVYIIVHELDEVVPSRVPKHYFAAAKHGNYIIVPKTRHSPKLMKKPRSHFEYIEHWVIATLEAIRMQDGLTSE
ncbi:MAG: YqiA/YcfP family alpha/beta fold hydrolase [Candidatus Saccharimonadales bacterium]